VINVGQSAYQCITHGIAGKAVRGSVTTIDLIRRGSSHNHFNDPRLKRQTMLFAPRGLANMATTGNPYKLNLTGSLKKSNGF